MMSRTHEIEIALRSLDAACQRKHNDDARAGTELERILGTDISPAKNHQARPASPIRRSPSPTRTGRKVVLVAAVLGAASVGVIALPSLPDGDRAFASWTPDPDTVVGTKRMEAAEACREHLSESAAADAGRLRAAEPAIAERRGVWTTVVLAGRDGFSGMCIADESSPFFAKGMIGSIGTPTRYVSPGPRELIANDLGSGTMNGADLSLAAGHAGSDIVAIVYRSPAYGDVTATVSRGRFALWLPGTELTDASRDGVELEVTYRDGSTASNRLTL
jgi:hypothetical protein